jgi:hypothetical protein
MTSSRSSDRKNVEKVAIMLLIMATNVKVTRIMDRSFVAAMVPNISSAVKYVSAFTKATYMAAHKIPTSPMTKRYRSLSCPEALRRFRNFFQRGLRSSRISVMSLFRGLI